MTPAETSTAESGLWKDAYDLARVRDLAEQFKTVHTKFDVDGFVDAVEKAGLLERELKDRVNLVASVLRDFLPQRYATATKLLIKVAPRVGMFANWTLTSYVEQFGLDQFDLSMATLKELTKYGTGEFAIRPFVIKEPERVLKLFHEWVGDDNEHIRRLAAEGSRPIGVWVAHVGAFRKDPGPVLNLLEKLKADESLYVRKAVANNLNDIAKDHPDLVIAACQRWKKNRHRRTDWIVKHGCRGLIKSGDPRVFPLLGFTEKPAVRVSPIKLSSRSVRIGEELEFAVRISSRAQSDQRLAVDYVVHFVKRGGKTSPKVFKLAEKSVGANERVLLQKAHSFQERSTRKHVPGKHRLDIVINGETTRSATFYLTPERG